MKMVQDSGEADRYLGQELARLDVGPVRACYLVPDQDLVRLAEAVTAASRRWGGVTEPILPVGPDGLTDERWPRIVAALAPDVYVSVGLDEQARAAAARQLGTSVLSWPDFTGDQPGYPWLWCHPLVVDGGAGDAPVPVPQDRTLRALAGVGVVDSALTWNMHGPGIRQPADELQCAIAQVARNTVAWLTA